MTYVMVNIPDYTLKVVNLAKTVWSTRIVVGQPGKYATPLLAETMKYITFNPTWNVPPSIIRNEYLPALERDPSALARIGLKVGRNEDGSIRIYQPPGERNALGRIRFNFPNRFLVYQHDTPNKHLFEKTARAYSHGCMREILTNMPSCCSRYRNQKMAITSSASTRFMAATSIPSTSTTRSQFTLHTRLRSWTIRDNYSSARTSIVWTKLSPVCCAVITR